jgi:phage baseplate assembly protein gpV
MAEFFNTERTQYVNSDASRGGALFYGVTTGRVVSTNDPQQMGRLYVHCPELGDPVDLAQDEYEDLPLCTYCSPLAGTSTSILKRGPSYELEKNLTNGPVTYGMWNIPKPGATVVVMCIDGNPTQRIWIGCIYDQFTTNTLPHGRFFYEDEEGNVPHPLGAPYGPLSGTEEPIQPIFDNQTEAFERREHNFEWRTRGADYQATAIFDNYLDPSPCNVTDDEIVEFEQEDGTVIFVVQGMAETMDRTNADSPDSSVYTWTTPGFHSITMDDRIENCRMRFRTTAGHQIILDDTNERIYINTCKGNNWMEFDEDGCVELFSTTKISVNAPDINLIGEATVRLFAYDSIHLKTEGSIFLDAVKNIQMTAGGDIMHTAGGSMLDNIGKNITESAGGNITEKAGGNITETAARIDMNGPTAPTAPKADPLDCFWPSRYPHHEPWARTGTKDDNSLEPKYEYDDPMVGREHKVRDERWRR